MNNKWLVLYLEMLNGIVKCWNKELTEIEKVENAFKIAHSCWEEVKGGLREFEFSSKDEEIKFYKNIKPKFTSYMEFVMLLNHALLFMPSESEEAKQMFWQHEAKRLNRFIEKNKAFVEYFKSKSTDHDQQYFLPENYDLANYIVSKPYDIDGEFMTSHDHLVACLIAEEMYHDYVEKKLKASPRPSPSFDKLRREGEE